MIVTITAAIRSFWSASRVAAAPVEDGDVGAQRAGAAVGMCGNGQVAEGAGEIGDVRIGDLAGDHRDALRGDTVRLGRRCDPGEGGLPIRLAIGAVADDRADALFRKVCDILRGDLRADRQASRKRAGVHGGASFELRQTGRVDGGARARSTRAPRRIRVR
jgi:hypothetical protein